MHSPDPEFDLLRLRRCLEEILAMVQTDQSGADFDSNLVEATVLTVKEDHLPAPEPATASADECPSAEAARGPDPSELDQRDEKDALFEDALVVVTEFGQASPAILQMWLSIDHCRATKILSELQADGLVSPKGRVRHKAYSLRRSEQGVTDVAT